VVAARPDAGALARRLAHGRADARAILDELYAGHDVAALEAALLEAVHDAVSGRDAELQALDAAREADPTWFQDARHVGYVAYADRFGGTLEGVRARLDHLEQLHVTYLHLMHVLRARPGDNDGGYAVMDYGAVEPSLGDRDDLRRLATELRRRGISLCLDLVMNHTAREHPWAVAARAGSAEHRGMYLVFPDRSVPDEFERTLPEVFPELAPGSFTFDPDLDGWVWTTFHHHQWDLDWSNPRVLVEVLRIVLDLADLGVEVIRLDAVAFTGKRLGTTCQNQPEAHLIAQALRAYLAMAAPAVVLKAEAIVGPAELLPYLGVHRTQRRECHLAYHNQLMVAIWDGLATGDATLAGASLASLPPTPSDTSWVTYFRCHDDIGWAIDDAVAAGAGVDGAAHRRHLAAFYRGDAPGSFASGAAFSTNPAAGDERTCGSAAALAGITRAVADGDEAALELAIRRVLLGHAVVFGWGGIPLVYMGDEVALGNDTSYLADPVRRRDSRWLHRPPMDWAAVERARRAGTVEQRVFDGIRHLAAVRRSTPALAAGGETWVHHLEPRPLLAWERRHPRHGRAYGLANLAPRPVELTAEALGWAGLDEPRELLGGDVAVDAERILLGPYAAAWFVDDLDAGVHPRRPR